MHPALFPDDIFIIALILPPRLPVLVVEIISVLSDLSSLLSLLLAPWIHTNTSHKFTLWELDPPHDTRLLLVRSNYASSEDLRAVSAIKESLRWCRVFSSSVIWK